MFKKSDSSIELQNLGPAPSIRAENLFVRPEWVHLVFDNINAAENASTELKTKGLVQTAPKVHKTHEGQPYGLGKFYMRIHPEALEGIVDAYHLSTSTNLTRRS